MFIIYCILTWNLYAFEHIVKNINNDIPSISVAVFNGSGVISVKHFPDQSFSPLYDIASISKIFTASFIMKLVQDEKLVITQNASTVLNTNYNGSVEQLLRHTSGLQAGLLEDQFGATVTETWNNILNIKSKHQIDKFKYSDINYLLLGKLAEVSAQESLSKQLENFNLNDVYYDVPTKELYRLMSTKQSSLGDVHDPTSRHLGGVTGHAGVFSSIEGLVSFLINFMKPNGDFMLNEKSIKSMTKMHKSKRGLGFDILSTYSRYPMGQSFTKGESFGHTGYTGCGFWIDKKKNIGYVLLSNAVGAEKWKVAKSQALKIMNEIATYVGEKY